jgi:hypothetical protein
MGIGNSSNESGGGPPDVGLFGPEPTLKPEKASAKAAKKPKKPPVAS